MTNRIPFPLREELQAKAVEQYRAKASIRNIAAALGSSYSTVRVLLLEDGVVLRARGGGDRRSPAAQAGAARA